MIENLIELRTRLIRCILVLSALTLLCMCFANSLFHYFSAPLLKQLPANQALIATSVTSPVMVPLKLSWYIALILSMPFLLQQVWAFITPALYQHEKKIAWTVVTYSTFLFYLGICFAYFLVFPIIFKFFANIVPQGVTFMPDISQYFEFCFQLFIAFGIAFEIPVFTYLLIKSRLVQRTTLQSYRSYVIVAAFIVAMFLTPPDVLSQILLAVPMCLLFEIGLWLAKDSDL